MKAIKLMPLLMAGLLVVLMASCGPAYVNTGVGYSRPYGYNNGYGYNPYGYGYSNPYGYYRPPVVVRPRYYAPGGRVYGGSPNTRGGFRGGSPNARGGFSGGGGGGRSRGPR